MEIRAQTKDDSGRCISKQFSGYSQLTGDTYYGVSPVCFYERTLGWEFYSSCTTKFLTPLKYIFLENSVELEYNVIISVEDGEPRV